MRKNCINFLLITLISLTASNALAAPAVFFKDSSAGKGSRTFYAHTPSAATASNLTRSALGNENMDLQVILPLSHQEDLKKLLKGLYDPKSPVYHKFLTPDQFNQQFRPSDLDINNAQSYFSSKGFSIGRVSQDGKLIKTSPNGTVLYIHGTVDKVNSTFGVKINYYKNSDGSTFYAPNANPVIQGDSHGIPNIAAVGGLDNLARFKPHAHQTVLAAKTSMAGNKTQTPKSIGTGPGGALAPSDVKKAYNLDTIPVINDLSTSQNIALFELDGYKLSDICTYETNFSISTNECDPNTSIVKNVPINGFNQIPFDHNAAGEVTIDIEEVLGIAYLSINNVFVYEASNTLLGWEDEWTRIANDNTSKIISCSWGDSELSAVTTTFDNNIFAQMAAQGQEVFVASGDYGANTDNTTTNLSVSEPADQPFITSVGISKAVLNSDESYSSESGSQFGGGGVSTIFDIPSYQQAMAQSSGAARVSQTMRNLPDVSLTADPATLYAFYYTDFGTGSHGAQWYGFWGSSIAAPTWAAFLTQVNQARANANKPNLGFINPLLYQIAGTGNYANDFHDITTGSNFLTKITNGNLTTTTSSAFPSGAVYPAGTGLDNVTGLGSFKGLNLLNDLVSQDLSAPSAPTGLIATSGNASITLSWNATSGATSYNIKRTTVDGGPYTTVASSIVATSFKDTGLTNGTAYFYVISAVNSAGESLNSDQANATPVLPPPGIPTNLVAHAGNNVVNLSWNASSDAESYIIYRKTDINGSFTSLDTTTNTSYTDNSAINGTTYYYVVTAHNSAGDSASSSNQVSATPMLILAPTNFTASLASWFLGSQVIQLKWTQSASSSIVQNRISYALGNSTTYTALPILSARSSVQLVSISKNTTYHFKITAINSNGTESPDSNIATVTTTKSSITITNQIWR